MSAEPNLLQDGIVTVTVVYFYRGVIEHPNWEAEILASLSNIQNVYAQTPGLFTATRDYLDFQSFMSKYTSLVWDWRIYGAVNLPEMYLTGPQQGGGYAMYHWHNQDPSEAERIWRASDIVLTVVQEEASGAALHNYGVVLLGTDSLWDPKFIEVVGEVAGYAAQRKQQLMILAHELGHNFGAPDHYSSTQPGYNHPDTSFGCIYGGYSTLDQYALLDKYCLDRIDWNYMTKASEGFIFYLDADPPPPEPPPPALIFIETYRGIDIYYDSVLKRCWFIFEGKEYHPTTLDGAYAFIDILIPIPSERCSVLFTVVGEFKNPLEGATVILNGYSGVTDYQGKLLFTGLALGTYSWSVSLIGHIAQGGQITCIEAVTYEMTVTLKTVTPTPPPPPTNGVGLLALIPIALYLISRLKKS